MISDLTIANGGALQPATNVPRGTTDLVLSEFSGGAMQPVRNVQEYLANRAPRPTIEGEDGLLITLPKKLQDEVKALVKACKFVADLVKDKWSVQAACKFVITREAYVRWSWNLNTFRQKFDAWLAKKDWVVLVNFSKAPASWRGATASLPEEFLAHCETKFGGFAREDGKRQALLAIQRNWRTGRDEHGNECAVPGYEKNWTKRDRENFPVGWSYTNITRQLKKRARATKAVLKLMHIGESAARELLPQMLGTRRNLRFLEKITFDDVRMDWLVFNPATGQAEELWLLVARDEATAMVLGFVMHPATIREDGSASHLGARQMKELAAYILERYPLPPYLVHWVVERGTATLAEGVKSALGELFNNRIKVHYTSMIGVKSPVGYAEKRKGNSRGKASHEAHNRLFHTQASFIEGQTGANWGIRPADLEARVKECREIHEFAQTLPESKRAEVKYPLLTLAQARTKFDQICHEQNCRDQHKLEDFEKVVEIFADGQWQVATEATPAMVANRQVRTRMERPYERAVRLIRAVERWERISPDIIVTFLEHTQRTVTVSDKGEVELMLDGRKIYFRAAGDVGELVPGRKALAYHHSGQPEFLHLTSGDGRILGTWVQRGRTPYLDQQALAEAMRYTHAAREAAVATANDLAKPQREKLEGMRASNAALEKFVVITDAPGATGTLGYGTVAGAFDAIQHTGAEMKTNPPAPVPMDDCTEDLLKRANDVPPASAQHWD